MHGWGLQTLLPVNSSRSSRGWAQRRECQPTEGDVGVHAGGATVPWSLVRECLCTQLPQMQDLPTDWHLRSGQNLTTWRHLFNPSTGCLGRQVKALLWGSPWWDAVPSIPRFQPFHPTCICFDVNLGAEEDWPTDSASS